MSYGPCPYAHEGCKFWGQEPVVKGEDSGCRTNEHHIYKRQEAQDLGKTAVQFASLPRNRIQICQADHEAIEAEWGWPEYPPKEVMERIIKADEKRI